MVCFSISPIEGFKGFYKDWVGFSKARTEFIKGFIFNQRNLLIALCTGGEINRVLSLKGF